LLEVPERFHQSGRVRMRERLPTCMSVLRRKFVIRAPSGPPLIGDRYVMGAMRSTRCALWGPGQSC
jgi:hypothetical protein